MKIAILKEGGAETRVAAIPETVKKFAALGATVAVEKGAGERASIADSEFEAAGAAIGDRADVLKDADAILCVAVICAPTDEEAKHLSKSMELTWLRLRQNDPQKIAPPEEADAHPWTEQERGFVKSQSDLWIVGSPDTVKAKIMEKVDETNADEVMVSTTIHDYDKRLESYRLLKEAWDA